MDAFTLTNPVFVTYAIAASLMVLKLILQGWVTVVRMMGAQGGFVSPEDAKRSAANPNPRPGQLDINNDVERFSVAQPIGDATFASLLCQGIMHFYN